MVLDGMDRKLVCKRLGIGRTQLYVGMKRETAREGLKSNGRPRQKTLRAPSRQASGRHVGDKTAPINSEAGKAAKRLTAAGYPISHTTVRTYLRKNLNTFLYKPSKRPKLTEEQKKRRLNFAKEHQTWTEEDWKRVLWSDESCFELFNPPNRQNDRVWAADASDVPPVPTVKHPPKVHVWGMMSSCAVSELHVVPQKVTINGDYYRQNILEEACLRAVHRTGKTGTILQRALVPDAEKAIFMQDGAPPHTAKRTQDWCRDNLPSFWAKGVWPGNSPDLNPIENLWAILKEKVSELPGATTADQLARQLRKAWAAISPDVLHNLVSSMPERMRQCIANKGGCVNK